MTEPLKPETGLLPTAARGFRFIASLKVAIPLLVLTVLVTVIGSLQPDRDFYRSGWYLALLGLNGLSLLLVTILHIPSILKKKGRNALIGVVATHLGILVLIAGAIYGGIAGFRHQVRAIEGEMTVVPGLPFVIRLDELLVEEYPDEAFVHVNREVLPVLPKKRQESHLTLVRSGKPSETFVAGPGRPAKANGITILPSIGDIGWYFELQIADPSGRVTNVPVKPWAPPLISVAGRPLMAHNLVDSVVPTVQLFTIEAEQMTPFGLVSTAQPLELDKHSIALGTYKRYTGLSVYNRPHAPILVIGSLAMLFGLVWHFHFRHRERRRGDVHG